MSLGDWTTLGELPPGAVFELQDGDIGMALNVPPGHPPFRTPSVTWKRLNEPGLNVITSRADEKARPLKLIRVGSSGLERAFVAALVDEPQDGATLNAFADWLRDERRERDAANLQGDWRQKVLEAVNEAVDAEFSLATKREREDSPLRPNSLERARERHKAAWAELRRRLGVEP